MTINYQRIYERLGFLFYAIASADNEITSSEIARLREMIENVWLPAESSTDEFGTDAGQYITISFEYLMNEGVESDLAFNEFRDYYLEHPEAFSKRLKTNIVLTAHAIARAFRGENKKELELIETLVTLFGK